MKIAIIRTGGKQYPVTEGTTVTVEKLGKKEGAVVTFSDILLYADGKQVVVGQPKVAGAKVTGKVLFEGKGKKVTVIKFKAKVRYRRKMGHRQQLTKVKIDKISMTK